MNAGVVPHVDTEAVQAYVVSARWFGGKGRPARVAGVRRAGRVGTGTVPAVVIDLVEVSYDHAPTDSPDSARSAEVELYQLPLALYPADQVRLRHALVGRWEDAELGPVSAYDGVHDQDAMAAWLAEFRRAPQEAGAASARSGQAGLAFHRIAANTSPSAAGSSLFTGEQTNSSVTFGDDVLLKVFRRVAVGRNPDIDAHAVLTRAGSEHVAPLHGWLSSDDLDLAMLQKFLGGASDGWDLACGSVRRLVVEHAQHSADTPDEFAGQAGPLGDAVSNVHAMLVAEFPTSQRGPGQMRTLADSMHRHLDRALRSAPGLAPHESAVREAYNKVADLPGHLAQRIHGDLHLGQTLLTDRGWKIVDFEGEPARHLAERGLPDSPWRDVAGMLRSFDYAARAVAKSQRDETRGRQARPGEHTEVETFAAAQEWSERHRAAFLDAYTAGRGVSEEEHTLLTAYTLDKAVYETVYETCNRPDWVTIPLAAIGRELGTGGSA